MQNLGTITQILAGLCTLNYVQFRAIFHLLIQKCLGFFFLDTRYISIGKSDSSSKESMPLNLDVYYY